MEFLLLACALRFRRTAAAAEGMLPLRGRWLLCLLAALPVAAAVMLPPLAAWPGRFVVPLCALLTAGWCCAWKSVITQGHRAKSIDVGTGILMIPETGGPVWEDLREELDLWQHAALDTLRRPISGESACQHSLPEKPDLSLSDRETA